ncbi:multicopper oxidase family protein [Micromonospora sp. RP3T]|uniref:multicopper oxidase family protein n=1 Tax=Micromonospora sp. RP3T TaxID=2135446 RepID=UPI003D710007
MTDDGRRRGRAAVTGPRRMTRRQVLAGAAASVALGAAVGGWTWAASGSPRLVAPDGEAVARVEATRRRAGGRTVTATLTPRPVGLDLGGPTVATWGYTDAPGGQVIRARAGDLLRVEVDNRLPVDTSVHWHGVALRNDMDGVPGLTQAPIPAGGRHTYAFTVPDPGTYFFHPHTGLQLDRALHGVLVVDDPAEPGRYDAEWIVVVDDWVDGTGRTPEEILTGLRGMGDMGGMRMTGGGMGMERYVSPLLGGTGDVTYPWYLLNGRVPTAPAEFAGRPRQRVRLRLVNAAADTAFRVALGGHRLTLTHTDGWPVAPTSTDALLLGMGERADVIVTLADGVFPLVASAEGKGGQAVAVVRTGAGDPPPANAHPRELDRAVLVTGGQAVPDVARLPERPVDRTHDLVLDGAMMPYRWTINGSDYAHSVPLTVRQGERVRLRLVNRSA